MFLSKKFYLYQLVPDGEKQETVTYSWKSSIYCRKSDERVVTISDGF